MRGYAGRYLRVNLSTGKVDNEPLPLSVAKDFLSGRGFGTRYLYEEVAPNADPLGEQNKLVLTTGVLAGTSAQGVSKWWACTRSPLTGAYARASSGGDFGAWMKFAGYDFIIIEGKAERPVYLYITGGKCQIVDAHELWGKDTVVTQEWLVQQHGKDVRVACIGIAGEKLVKYAAIVSGRRTASRCGVGTVMGSKLLKAVAIKAKRNLNLHDPDGFRQVVKEQIDIIRASKKYHRYKREGTTDGAISVNMLGVYPTRNYRYGQLIGYEQLGPEEYKKLETGAVGCYSCSARCGKIHSVTSGPYAGAVSEGPEYESYWSFSGPIESSSIEATVAADQLCDDLGLDTMSTGGSIGFAYELYEKGIINKNDTDGLELTYGNHSAMVALIKKIGQREGFGDLLAEGTRRAAERIGKGAEAYAMQVKGLELGGYEPRGLKGTALGYATSSIGGSHTNGSLCFQEWGVAFPRAVPRFIEEGKADIVKFNQDDFALMDCCACIFATLWGFWFPQLIGRMLVAATGIDEFADYGYLAKVGERIQNLERAFNVRNGFGRAQDTIPRRFLTEPLHTREAEGEGQIVRGLEALLDDYYRVRGWTIEEGIPYREKLEELGLGYVVKDMEPLIGQK